MTTLINAKVDVRSETDRKVIQEASVQLNVPKDAKDVTKDDVIRAAQIEFGGRFFNLIDYKIIPSTN